ncbi:MAG TPA: hypothetical protein PLU72_20005 [Candidatus Ozemobacteraceae bacterium]|nr:hypothetical protein [Candidatus Ozemobacteraceae bacterium]
MNGLRRRGIALPIVFGIILCFAVWVGSLSWTMSNSRGRFMYAFKLRKAYFMARSALQHFFLKMKVMQRRLPETMAVLEGASTADWNALSSSFIEDIVIPEDAPASYTLSYGIDSFSIGSRDLEKGEMTIEIVAGGKADGLGESIRRIYRVTR